MLLTVFLSVLTFAVLFAGMAIGVIVANKPVKGSCGGLSALGMEGECEICGGNKDKCDEEKGRGKSKSGDTSALAYDALKPRQ